MVIFGYSEQIKTDPVCDLIILLAKFYIYYSKHEHIFKWTILQILHRKRDWKKFYKIQKCLEAISSFVSKSNVKRLYSRNILHHNDLYYFYVYETYDMNERM